MKNSISIAQFIQQTKDKFNLQDELEEGVHFEVLHGYTNSCLKPYNEAVRNDFPEDAELIISEIEKAEING